MANTFKILRRAAGGAAGAPTLEAGQLAVNFSDDKLYVGDGTSAVPIAGRGEFVDLGTEQSVTGKKNFTAATVSTAPVDANDVVRKSDLDSVSSAVTALGSAFNYVGTINGGADAGSATDLSALTEKDAGDFYKVGTSGHFVLGGTTLFANSGDGIVFNLDGGVDKIDNTNSTVAGTANEIAVTGSADTGYTVAIDSVFSGLVSDVESKTQNINLVSTAAGTTQIDGVVNVVGSVGFVGINENEILADGLTSDFTIGTTSGDPTNNNLVITSNAGSSSMTLQATAVNVTGNLVGSGSSTLDGFVLDAGTF